tara:strand:- start:1396 stop:2223 length:828 start_codon:yes stop_codon:yes gene_type:complete
MADDFEQLDLAEDLPEFEEDQEQPEEQEEQEEQPELEDEDKVSPGVQKRLDKMTFKHREEERRRVAAEERLELLQSRMDKFENSNQEQQVKSFRETYDATKIALQKAVEDGDTEGQVSNMERIADMRARAMMVGSKKEEEAAQQQQQPPQAEQPPQLAMDWWQRNQWFNQPGSEQATYLARAVDAQLDAEGFDKNDPEYYTELDNRLQNPINPSYTKPKSGAGNSNPVAPAQKSASASKKGGRPRLTRSQLAMAQELGLSTEEELKEYATEIGRG